jgi:hypothetical protein
LSWFGHPKSTNDNKVHASLIQKLGLALSVQLGGGYIGEVIGETLTGLGLGVVNLKPAALQLNIYSGNLFGVRLVKSFLNQKF